MATIHVICARCAVIFSKDITDDAARALGIDPNRAIPTGTLYMRLCSEHESTNTSQS